MRQMVTIVENVDLQLHIQTNSADIQAEIKRLQTDGYPALFDTESGIVILEIAGTLGKHYNSFSQSTSTVMMRRTLRELRRAEQVKGVILKIDSPGGTVAGQKDFADEIKALNEMKPVYAYIEDLGASAAYWAASQAHRVYANDMAYIGSIGTYGVVMDASKMAENEGVVVHVIRAGEQKGIGTLGTKITEEHLNIFQREIDVLNEFFISAISEGRDISIEQVRQLATGQIWIGAEAIGIGLIDGIRTLDAVFSELQDEIKQSEDSNMSILNWRKKDDDQGVVTDSAGNIFVGANPLAEEPPNEEERVEELPDAEPMDDAENTDNQQIEAMQTQIDALAEENKNLVAQNSEVASTLNALGEQLTHLSEQFSAWQSDQPAGIQQMMTHSVTNEDTANPVDAEKQADFHKVGSIWN